MQNTAAPVKPDGKDNDKKKKFWQGLWKGYLQPALIALVIALIVTQVLIFNARVPTESMVPTVQAGDRLIGWRLAYLFDHPQQGDIILFKSYEQSNDLYGKTLVKRVIGVAGDRVRVSEGVVYVNDSPIDEPYVVNASNADMAEIYVPEGCCFVMGDNRANSYDGRYWLDPFVREEDIYAKVVWIYYPDARIPE